MMLEKSYTSEVSFEVGTTVTTKTRRNFAQRTQIILQMLKEINQNIGQ